VKTKILLIGLDAADPDVMRAMAARGELPTLARLLETGAAAPTRNPYGLFVGSLWSSFFTARFASRTGFHCWEEVDTRSYERRLTSALEIRGTPFWETLSDAGRRVAVLDVPHSRVNRPVDGVVMCEYGCHDRHFGFHTWPPELARQTEERFGLHPILTVDPYEAKDFAPDDYVHRAGQHRTHDEERALLSGLLEGLERKRRVSMDLLERGGWDLFLTVLGDSHSVGHQHWHLHDPSHPWHDAELAAELGSPLARVYQRMDAVVADHLAAAGPEATVFVLLSHGMGPHYDATHLLPETLRRLDAAYDGGITGGAAMRAAKRLWAAAPASVKRAVQPAGMALLRRRLARHPLPVVRDWSTAQERAAARFYLAPNNFVYGGVRINLAGREPQGRVQPGAEFEAVCDRLTEDLMALVNVDTGGPVVNGVARTADYHERDPEDTLPDLLIDWARDAAVDTVWSPRTGIVHGRYDHWRTGDHRPDGLLLACGPDFEAGARLPTLDLVDLGTSLAARLGVTLGDDTDGRLVPWIASSVLVGG
jgi:predicted AlkP superfamily phosphohydrolase/phosphomutase